ncbi:hypothetical protein Pint_18152 [Pistacia integerrima]|uniref:Uncharacterized protein n=1 Tax=Pistacia integerrima TaxID=434235 RepID=A0ACC0YXT4_9ROSI|nr:hypothetical protein Pint_18152 [Pistacia integerrima]
MLVLVEFAESDAVSLLPYFCCDSRAFSSDFCCYSVVFARSDAGACWRSSSRKMHFLVEKLQKKPAMGECYSQAINQNMRNQQTCIHSFKFLSTIFSHSLSLLQ